MKQTAEIFEITEQMLDAAETERWPIFYELENKRHTMIQHFFAHHKPPHAEHHLVDLFEHVLAIDRKIIALLESGMHDIMLKTREISLGRRAILAYAQRH